MLSSAKDGTVVVTASPFLKVVLTVIAAALCLIAVRGFLGPEPLYAQAGFDEVDVHVKSFPRDVEITVVPKWTAFPVEVKGAVEINE
ncbi:MAG: hypothetical protein PVH29_15025 [Candidatus Zixiibacteriota bacterium]|jgi:hypothetical protein